MGAGRSQNLEPKHKVGLHPLWLRNLDRDRQVAKLAYKYGTLHSLIEYTEGIFGKEDGERDRGKMFLAEESVAAEDPMAFVA